MDSKTLKTSVRGAVKVAPEVLCLTYPRPSVRVYILTYPLDASASADTIRSIPGVTHCGVEQDRHRTTIRVDVGVECQFGVGDGIHHRINEILKALFPIPAEVRLKKVNAPDLCPNQSRG